MMQQLVRVSLVCCLLLALAGPTLAQEGQTCDFGRGSGSLCQNNVEYRCSVNMKDPTGPSTWVYSQQCKYGCSTDPNQEGQCEFYPPGSPGRTSPPSSSGSSPPPAQVTPVNNPPATSDNSGNTVATPSNNNAGNTAGNNAGTSSNNNASPPASNNNNPAGTPNTSNPTNGGTVPSSNPSSTTPNTVNVPNNNNIPNQQSSSPSSNSNTSPKSSNNPNTPNNKTPTSSAGSSDATQPPGAKLPSPDQNPSSADGKDNGNKTVIIAVAGSIAACVVGGVLAVVLMRRRSRRPKMDPFADIGVTDGMMGNGNGFMSAVPAGASRLESGYGHNYNTAMPIMAPLPAIPQPTLAESHMASTPARHSSPPPTSAPTPEPSSVPEPEQSTVTTHEDAGPIPVDLPPSYENLLPPSDSEASSSKWNTAASNGNVVGSPKKQSHPSDEEALRAAIAASLVDMVPEEVRAAIAASLRDMGRGNQHADGTSIQFSGYGYPSTDGAGIIGKPHR